MTTKKRGRPEKVTSERRENVLRIRLTETERAILERAVKDKGLDTSTWARMILLESAR
jgi:hypothetical protein